MSLARRNARALAAGQHRWDSMCPADDPPTCGLGGCDEDAVPSDDPDRSSACGPCGDKLEAFRRWEDGELEPDDMLVFGDFIRAHPEYVPRVDGVPAEKDLGRLPITPRPLVG